MRNVQREKTKGVGEEEKPAEEEEHDARRLWDSEEISSV